MFGPNGKILVKPGSYPHNRLGVNEMFMCKDPRCDFVCDNHMSLVKHEEAFRDSFGLGVI
jgi:hypothetical protein